MLTNGVWMGKILLKLFNIDKNIYKFHFSNFYKFFSGKKNVKKIKANCKGAIQNYVIN